MIVAPGRSQPSDKGSGVPGERSEATLSVGATPASPAAALPAPTVIVKCPVVSQVAQPAIDLLAPHSESSPEKPPRRFRMVLLAFA
jgi:hypothetical protein